MNVHRMLVREIVGVVLAIAAITTAVLVVAHRHAPPRATVASAPPPARVLAPEERGAQLYERKGCVSCHSVDGTSRVGPSFLHDYGSTITLDDGTRIAMNDAYIHESIVAPRAKSRPGYPAAMPVYDGLLTPRDIDDLAAYIRSLK